MISILFGFHMDELLFRVESFIFSAVNPDLASFYVKLQENLLCTLFFNTTLFCRNVSWIYLNSTGDIRKWHFDVHLLSLHKKSGFLRHPSSRPLPPTQFYCSFGPPKGENHPKGRTANIIWSAVQHSASQKSRSVSVLGQIECSLRQVLSWVRSLAFP